MNAEIMEALRDWVRSEIEFDRCSNETYDGEHLSSAATERDESNKLFNVLCGKVGCGK